MSAGQTLTLQWQTVSVGATEVRGIAVQFQYGGDDLRRRSHVREGPPARPQVVSDALLPPGKDEALEIPASLELETIVLADLPEGQVRLRRRGGGTVVLPPAQEGLDTWPLRLYLDVEPRRPTAR